MKLNTMHPVLSRIEPWLQFRLGNTEMKFVQENQWSAHEEALNLCNSQKLVQTVYFLNRDLTFMKEVRTNITFNHCTGSHATGLS